MPASRCFFVDFRVSSPLPDRFSWSRGKFQSLSDEFNNMRGDMIDLMSKMSQNWQSRSIVRLLFTPEVSGVGWGFTKPTAISLVMEIFFCETLQVSYRYIGIF